MVLWHLEAALEPSLSEPLDPDYLGLLNAARSRVKEG